VAVTVGLFLLLGLADFWPSVSFWFASYFLASVIVYLLNVVLLSKVLGPVLSRERSLILLIFNIVQVVLIFAIFYRWKLPNLGFWEALIDAVLVFGTVSLPSEIEVGAKPFAAFQVAIDFMLLAVFLAHFVGGLGTEGSTNAGGAKP
jgi:hypothetical protein